MAHSVPTSFAKHSQVQQLLSVLCSLCFVPCMSAFLSQRTVLLITSFFKCCFVLSFSHFIFFIELILFVHTLYFCRFCITSAVTTGIMNDDKHT